MTEQTSLILEYVLQSKQFFPSSCKQTFECSWRQPFLNLSTRWVEGDQRRTRRQRGLWFTILQREKFLPDNSCHVSFMSPAHFLEMSSACRKAPEGSDRLRSCQPLDVASIFAIVPSFLSSSACGESFCEEAPYDYVLTLTITVSFVAHSCKWTVVAALSVWLREVYFCKAYLRKVREDQSGYIQQRTEYV